MTRPSCRATSISMLNATENEHCRNSYSIVADQLTTTVLVDQKMWDKRLRHTDVYHIQLIRGHITDSIALSAKRRYLSYSKDDF